MTREIETLRLSSLLPVIRDVFRQVPDLREPEESAFQHELSDVLMGGLAMMFVQDPAMLEFQARLQDRRRGNNLRTIFGLKLVPRASQFRRILETLDPSTIQNAYSPILKQVQKTRLWSG